MAYLIDFVLHIDSHLVTIVNTFGNWTYLILFAIIFIETGAVIMPFLPGDSDWQSVLQQVGDSVLGRRSIYRDAGGMDIQLFQNTLDREKSGYLHILRL